MGVSDQLSFIGLQSEAWPGLQLQHLVNQFSGSPGSLGRFVQLASGTDVSGTDVSGTSQPPSPWL